MVPAIFCARTSVGLIGRPSSLAKVRKMALVSLSKSSKASCYGHCDCLCHLNRHCYCDLIGHWNRHGYRDRLGYWNRHSFFRNCTVHICFINAEVAKTVTCLLRYLCSSLTWPFLSLLKQVRWLRSLRAALTTLGALVRLCFKWHYLVKSLFWMFYHSRTARDISTKSVGACAELDLFRTTHLEDPK